MSGNQTWPPTSTLHLFPWITAVLSWLVFFFSLNSGPKSTGSKWTSTGSLQYMLILKEWLMNIADTNTFNWKVWLSFWCEGTFAQMNHHGCGGIFLEWITLVNSLAGGHTPVWTFHSLRQWYCCWLYPLCHEAHWQVGTYLDTHTHSVKRRRMQCLSLDLNRVN